MKKKWQEDEEWQKKRKISDNYKPNKLEQYFGDIIDEFSLPFKYVGDYQIRIDGLNPDFIHNSGEKIAIEILGNYWHDEKEFQNRKKRFAKYGWNCLDIWESELKNNSKEEIVKKIIDFFGGSLQLTISAEPSINLKLFKVIDFEGTKKKYPKGYNMDQILYKMVTRKEYLKEKSERELSFKGFFSHTEEEKKIQKLFLEGWFRYQKIKKQIKSIYRLKHELNKWNKNIIIKMEV